MLEYFIRMKKKSALIKSVSFTHNDEKQVIYLI